MTSSNPSLTSSASVTSSSGYGTLPVTPACSTDTLCPLPTAAAAAAASVVAADAATETTQQQLQQQQLSSSCDTLINSSRDSLVDCCADYANEADFPPPSPPPDHDYEILEPPAESNSHETRYPDENNYASPLPNTNNSESAPFPARYCETPPLRNFETLPSKNNFAMMRRASTGSFHPSSGLFPPSGPLARLPTAQAWSRDDHVISEECPDELDAVGALPSELQGAFLVGC